MQNNKRTIPQIRARLREIADEYGIPELHDLADETYRNSPIRRAAVNSVRITPELAEQIRQYANQNPKLHQRDVAWKFNVNPGRVSEALNNLI